LDENFVPGFASELYFVDLFAVGRLYLLIFLQFLSFFLHFCLFFSLPAQSLM
jgi:hypothetical protein